jgi:hypothetical protein
MIGVREFGVLTVATDGYGACKSENTVFINVAQKFTMQPVVVDFYK